MIGLSVSFCVRDIVEGQVALSDVEKIIGGTAAANEADWDYVISRYQQVFWKKYPIMCADLLKALVRRGKIEQPRLAGKGAPCIGYGHWVKDESEITWGLPDGSQIGYNEAAAKEPIF